MATRKAVFSGSWYPATAAACETQIKSFLKDTHRRNVSEGRYVGGIVPHAGWVYSGSLACNVIAHLCHEPLPDVVVVYGMHLHPESPRLIATGGQWETPLGPLEVDAELAAELMRHASFSVDDGWSFGRDNTIELQLPFIKYFFSQTKVLPIGVPPHPDTIVLARRLGSILQDKGVAARVLGSTDLTHYGGNYGFAPRGRGPAAVAWVKEHNDRQVIDAMLSMNPEAVIEQGLSHHNACCAGAAAAAIATAAHLGGRAAKLLAHTTSYDKSPGDNFVGYVGMVF